VSLGDEPCDTQLLIVLYFMQDYGLVTVITPSYNTARFIAETIRSVQAQTYPNWEMIIVDDCSSDDTDGVVAPFLEQDERIRYVKNAQNSGAAVSRNKALRMARGKWIAFLDSDDVWMPEKLEHQLRFMVENHYHFSYHEYEEMDEDSVSTGVKVSGIKKISKYQMYAFCWPGCLTVMYDRESLGELQIYDIKKNNDYAMWLKLIPKADCYLVSESLASYRRGRKGSVSSHGYFTLVKWHYKLWKQAMEMNIIAALFWTGVNLVFGFYKKIRFISKR